MASAGALATVLKTYEEYREKIEYPENEDELHEKAITNVSLLSSSIMRINTAVATLQGKVDKMEEQFRGTKSKTEQKDLLGEVQEIEKESHFSKLLADAENFIHILEAQLTDAKINLSKAQRKLKIHPSNECAEGTSTQCASDTNSVRATIEEGSNADSTARTRSVKPPNISLPRFYGNQEEFPEYWAVYESLIHNSSDLSTIEKIVLLKDSLKGKAEKAIKGIQPIAKNYEWMIDTLKDKFGNQPANRSRIVQKLFDLKPAARDAKSCDDCLDAIKALVNQLVSTEYDIRATSDPMWTETIIKKFPYALVKDILTQYQENKGVTIAQLLKLLEKEISSKLFIESQWGFNNETKKDVLTKPTHQCAFCGRTNHASAACRTVQDPQKRREIVKQKRLCRTCMQSNHTSNQCNRPDCSSCGQKHNSSLCLNGTFSATAARAFPSPLEQRQRRNETSHQPPRFGQRHDSRDNRFNNRNSNDARRMQQTNIQHMQAEQENNRSPQTVGVNENGEQLILMTAEGNLWNNNKQKFERVLFFFDTGAQKTVIEEKLASEFGLPRLSTESCVMSGIGGHIERFESTTVPLKIRSVYGKEINVTARTKPIITGGFPSVNLTQADADFLEINEICLANSKLRGERQVPKILVGLDRYYSLVIEEGSVRKTPSGLRIAKTVFGPAIYGQGNLDSPQNTPPISYGLTSIHETSDNQLLQKLFELDGLGITPEECLRDEKAENYFMDYSKLISFEKGYVTAPFPLKTNVAELQDNYSVAIKRLASLEKQLKSNADQSHWYSKILRDYEDQDVIERIYDNDLGAVGTYYMPHSGVWRPHKKVPLRVVFDASSKKRGQLSLNDIIHRGESFINKVHDILISSRFARILLLCDIEAAFTQIRLEDTHKDLCRFLWLKDLDKPLIRPNIIEYRFKRLPFGITASPSILNMTLLAYLRSMDTSLSNEIARNLYVDNILLSAESEEEALNKYSESKQLFSKIGMNLREYVSSCQAVNDKIPQHDRADSGDIKLLGVSYNTQTDRYTVETNFTMKDRLTKRDIVSQINSVYDPLGIAGPLIIGLKSLMREIFNSCQNWDDRVPNELHKKWNAACSNINGAYISIPRALVAVNSDLTNTALWLFADASKSAIATCAYLLHENAAITHLLSGKTKLAPKKSEQTIPRLELLGILIAMRLGSSILHSIEFTVKRIVIATDSEIALCWLKSDRKLPLFVSNQCSRILKIKSVFEENQCEVNFYHVPTLLNPADAGTRGLTSSQINDHSWLQGPRWLNDPETLKRLTPISILSAKENQEEDDIVVTNVEIEQNLSTQGVFDTNRFSRLSIALRTVAGTAKLLHRWVARTNKKGTVNIEAKIVSQFNGDIEITSEDVEAARKLLIIELHKSIDLKDLQQRFPGQKIMRDSEGIIRHLSRLQNASLPYDTKSPIFLPNKCNFTKLVLQDIHRSNAHCGKDHTLAIARQTYWIPRSSSAFKNATKNCTICKRWQGLPSGAPEMPPLPKDRIVVTKPFANAACDYMGPFVARNADTMYVCLFTCLTTRAVHLEVVENLSGGAFLNCFIRFISRRGVPQLMRSDCGSNFKLGSKMIDLMFENDATSGNSMMGCCAINGIKWIFNPPASPWMGGVWERLVGSVKKCLHKSVGRKKLSFTAMNTAMTRIEAIINTRPLTKLNSTELSEIPLRPVDFLQGNLKFSLPNAENLIDKDDSPYEPDLIQTVDQAREALRSAEVIASKFWECWNNEYLVGLRESQKSLIKQERHVPRASPEVGEIVLIGEELLPRGSWSYGKVTEIITSTDGLVRSAKVLLPNRKVIQRPLNKIYPLEIRSSCSNELEPQQVPLDDPHTTVNQIRKRLERQSKTRAYDIIRAFEDELNDSQSNQQSDAGHAVRPSLSPKSNTRSRQIGHNQKTVLAITLMAIINLVGVQSLTPNIVCDAGKVTVSPPWHKFELCFDSECQMFHNRNTNMIYYLPISPSNGKVKVDIKDDNGTTVLSENCCRPEFCIESGKFLSKSLLGNPHCWPVGAILSVAVMLYLTVSVILLICWTSKFLTRSEERCTSKQIENNSEVDQDKSTGMEMINTHGFAPTPLSGRFTVTLLIVLYVANSTSACQHGFLRHTTEMVCDQNGKCGYEIWKELLFNRIQSKYCIEIHRHNKTVGMVSIKLSAVKYTCVKSSMFFTRDTDYHIFSSLRCPEMGSCSAGQCDSLQPNETIPELRGSRKYPGYSACDYTCGGILCGCLLPTPACLFYRVAHIPVSKDVYEVFKCQDWIPSIQVEIRSQLFGVNETKNYTIQPYVESKLSTMNVTVLSIRKPDQPLINRRFAQSSHSTIILPELFRNPVECATRDDARKRFHVCENKIICSCSGGTTPHHCKCPDDAIGHLHRDTSNILPLETAYLRIHSEGQNIVAESHEGELTIAIGSTLFTNSSEFIINEQCDIVLHDLVGCYSCVHGSEVIATCTSQHKNEVLVNCQKYGFTVGCSPDGENTTVRINHDSAIVDEACYVTCGDTTTNLTIKGLLVYHQTANLSVFWHNSQEAETEWGDLFDFHLPDLNPLVETIKHHWKMVVALAIATTTLLSLTYFLGPVVIIALFKVLYATLKCLAAPFLWMLSTARSLIVEVLRN